MFHELPPGLPSLAFATKAQKRAAAVGFDFPDVGGGARQARRGGRRAARRTRRPRARRRAVRRRGRGAGGRRRPRAGAARLGTALPGTCRAGGRAGRRGRRRVRRRSRPTGSCSGTKGRSSDLTNRRVEGPGGARPGGARARTCGTSSRADPARGPGADARRRRPAPRLLQEPRRRARRSSCWSRSPSGPGCARAPRRCSAASAINVTEDRAVLHVALRAPRDAVHRVDGARRGARRARGARPDGRPGRPGAHGGVDGRDRQAHPQRGQHRHRRLRPRARRWPTGRCADFADPRADVALRLERRRHATSPTRRAASTPAETLFIVSSKTFTTLETLTNARTARDVAGRRARRRRRGAPRTSSPSRPTPRRSRPSASTPTNMFGFWDWVGGRYSMDSAIGLSLMIAIGPERFREMLAGFHADGRALPHRAARAQHAGAAGAARRLVTRTSSAPRRTPCCPTASTWRASPPTSSSSTWRATASRVDLRRRGRSTYATGPDRLGRAGHQRPARLLPAHPPGHAAGARATSSASARPARDARRATTTC